MTVEVAAPSAGYPLRYDVQYPERTSRLLNLPLLIKPLLAIPHLIILYALLSLVSAITLVAFFAILFTRRYPRGLFDLAVNTFRWNANVSAYTSWYRDEYPPFGWEAGAYPVTYEVDYPERLSRWLPLVKWLLVIPHLVALILLSLVGAVLLIVLWFAVLISGRYPRGIFNFMVGLSRWSNRVSAYFYLLTDRYPPFSLE